MKKLLSYSLILFFIGLTFSGCENATVKKDTAEEIPELLMEIMGLSPNEAGKIIREKGYITEGGHYKKGLYEISFQVDNQLVTYAVGKIEIAHGTTKSSLTNTAFIWLNSADVMNFNIIEASINSDKGNTAYSKLSDMKSDMKNITGEWEINAYVKNNKGIAIEIQGISSIGVSIEVVKL